MYRNFRPDPLNATDAKKRLNLDLLTSDNKLSVSPAKVRDSQNFLSTKGMPDISHLKIFEEGNDEGPHETWNDKIKKYRHLTPTVAESLNLINLKHEIANILKVKPKFFDKRNQNQRASPLGGSRNASNSNLHSGDRRPCKLV